MESGCALSELPSPSLLVQKKGLNRANIDIPVFTLESLQCKTRETSFSYTCTTPSGTTSLQVYVGEHYASIAAWIAVNLIRFNASQRAEAESQDRTYEDLAGPARKCYIHLIPEKNTGSLDIGYTVGCRHSSCSSLAGGATQRTRDYSPCITGHRCDRGSGQASSRAKDILIRI